MALTENQIKIVKSTVPVLQQHGTDITKYFYQTMLDEHPELKNIFNQSNQANQHQAKALAGAVYAYAANIDNLAVLGSAVEKICQKHASLLIKPEQYAIVGKHLLGAMDHILGAALTEEVLDAWSAAYWQLANLMIQREKDILNQADDWKDWRDFTIADKVKETDEITSFYLKPVNGKQLPTFHPGQYISVQVTTPKLPYAQVRQYSLSDAPRSDYYRISVRKDLGLNVAQPGAERHPGCVSNVLHDEKKVGDVVRISPPAGEFYVNPSDNNGPVVMISAGVGVTPMISILNSLVETGSKQKVVFIHGARTTSTQAFGSHVRSVAADHPNVTPVSFIKSPEENTDVYGVNYHHKSRVQLDVLDKQQHLCLDQPSTRYFLCGPDSFSTDIHNRLTELGVNAASISMDKFNVGQVVA